MKLVLIVSLLFLWKSSFATDHYFASSGNDGNPGTITQPWQTLNKLNMIFNTLNGGDIIHFNRGDVFYGQIKPNKSFPVGNPLIITSYGVGAQPVITGFTNVATWTNLGANIWESTFSISTLTSCNEVVVLGVNIAMGRTPNTGYYTYQSFSKTSLTSTDLTGTPNWTGAKAVIRKNNWLIDIDTITSQSGSTIVHTSNSVATGTNNYGFFIENDARTLDIQNEWYYNPSTKKIRIYSTSMPGTFQVSSIDTLVNTKLFDNITFDSLTFTGSNKDVMVAIGSSHIHIYDCNFNFNGKDGIWGGQNVGAGSGTDFQFMRDTVNHTNNNFITFAQEFTNGIISHNVFKNTGLQPGMGGDGSDKSFGTDEVIQTRGAGTIIEWNRFDSTGYVDINYLADNQIIRFNYLSNGLMVKSDGGLIYTWNGITGAVSPVGRKVYNNILLYSDGLTSLAGTTLTQALVHGLYEDANNKYIEFYNNTVAYMAFGGGYMYSGSQNNNWHDNTFYNNGFNQMRVIDQFSNGQLTTTDTIKNNIFVAKSATQYVSTWTTNRTASAYLATAGLFDSNYYARPIAQTGVVNFLTGVTGSVLTLPAWKTFSSNDTHTNPTAITISDTSRFRFIYNDTSVNKDFIMGALYADVKGHRYTDTITLTPFTSKVLIYDTALASLPPVVDAGTSQTITLPTNSVTLTGTATSPNMGGSIVSHTWTQDTGLPGSITSPSSLSTGVTGLSTGNYIFKLTAVDNVGNTAFDTMHVVVIDSTVIPPIADAGTDQSITTNNTTLDGTGSHDTDGTIVSYAWTQDSGPNTASITSSSSATTGVTGLITGTYVFRLTVVNNGGASDDDTVQVIVNYTPPVDGSILIVTHGNFIFTK